MKTYVDTSFLVSLYSLDTNSAAAANTMQTSKGEHLLTTFAELELINAMQLRVFRKEQTAIQSGSALDAFAIDLRDGVFRLTPLPEQVFDRAREVSLQTTAQLGTRAADLLHVAAALELRADRLYSFDQQQRKLAKMLHLKLN